MCLVRGIWGCSECFFVCIWGCVCIVDGDRDGDGDVQKTLIRLR